MTRSEIKNVILDVFPGANVVRTHSGHSTACRAKIGPHLWLYVCVDRRGCGNIQLRREDYGWNKRMLYAFEDLSPTLRGIAADLEDSRIAMRLWFESLWRWIDGLEGLERAASPPTRKARQNAARKTWRTKGAIPARLELNLRHDINAVVEMPSEDGAFSLVSERSDRAAHALIKAFLHRRRALEAALASA